MTTRARQLYINLPVADLARSQTFFAALGFEFNPQWSDETALCMILGDAHYAMLITRTRFQDFVPQPVSDAWQASEVIVSLDLPGRDEVDRLSGLAVEHGGQVWKDAEDHGFMYYRAFRDPDGHVWELLHMQEQPASA